MKLPRRQFLHLAVGAAALPTLPRIARAQTYPTRPVRWIVGYPPAGATDIAARLIGQWLSDRLGQPFVIENRPGASGNIGTEAVVNAPPDGYTLLLVNAGNAINATLYEKLKYNLIRDIAPVAGIIRVPLVMQVNLSVPVKTVPEFIAYRAGGLRPLAVTTATRLEALSEIPTVSDFLPGYEASGWYGVGAPKNTPTEIVDKLNKEINAALANPKMKTQLADLGGIVLTLSPAEFGKLIADETEKWGKVIRAANIKPE